MKFVWHLYLGTARPQSAFCAAMSILIALSASWPALSLPASTTECDSSSQRSALLQFNAATSGSSWSNPWPVSAPLSSLNGHCTWFGVQCCPDPPPTSCNASSPCKCHMGGLVTGIILQSNQVGEKRCVLFPSRRIMTRGREVESIMQSTPLTPASHLSACWKHQPCSWGQCLNGPGL